MDSSVLFALLLITTASGTGLAALLPLCGKVNITESWVQRGGSTNLYCPSCSTALPCHWGTFTSHCTLQENVSCNSSTCSVTVNSNADAKLLHCCSNESASLPQHCFAVYVCAYRISAAPESAVYVGLLTNITVVLSGYPPPIANGEAYFFKNTNVLITNRIVPPDEANVTFIYTFQSTISDTFSAYYHNSNVCADCHVTVDIHPSTPLSPSSTVLSSNVSSPCTDTAPQPSHSPLETTLPQYSSASNSQFVSVTAGLSISIALAFLFAVVLVGVCVKIKAYDVCCSSYKHGKGFSVLHQRKRKRLSEASTPLPTPCEEAIDPHQDFQESILPH